MEVLDQTTETEVLRLASAIVQAKIAAGVADRALTAAHDALQAADVEKTRADEALHLLRVKFEELTDNLAGTPWNLGQH